MTQALPKQKFIELSFKRKSIWCAVVFFILTLVIGLFQYRDYGISFDEPVSRDNGAISLKYVLKQLNLSFFENDTELKKINVSLNEYRDRDYGVVFDLPVFALERALKINDPQKQFLLRHLITFFLFWISTIAFYFLLKNSFTSHIYALLGTIMLFLSPRIFADAFYNSKDITLMSLGIICSLTLYFFVVRLNHISALVHGIVCALVIDTRIVGLVFAVVTLMYFMSTIFVTRDKRRIYVLITYVISLSIFVYIFWPWLWERPVSNLRLAFSNMANFRWPNYNHFWGEYILALDLPWHYAPTWILFTTPPIYLFLAALGIFLTLKSLYQTIQYNTVNLHQSATVPALLIIMGTLTPIILLNSTLYDGWRQLYFIYPSILLLATFGLKEANTFLLRINAKALLTAIVMILGTQFVLLFVWMRMAHPFQNVYFNRLAPKNAIYLFEGDYWGLSNLSLLNYIEAHDSRPVIRISSFGATSIAQSLMMLPTQSRSKSFIYVQDAESADYVLTNFRFFSKTDAVAIGSTWRLWHTVNVDGHIIGAIYKKTNDF